VRFARAALALGLISACSDGPKPANGDRVSLTTEVVDRVCLGTLEHIDAEIERIESELAFTALADRVELHVVASETIEQHCGRHRVTCVTQPPRRLYIAADVYDQLLRRELARDRIARTRLGRSKPLFYEGLAAALTHPSCEPLTDHFYQPSSVSETLGATTASGLGEEGRYLGGELLAWLLEHYGPQKVRTFMSTVGRFDHPDVVRVLYIEHFTSVIDEDLYAHWRPNHAPVDPGRRGCTAAELARDESSMLRITTTLDCGAAEVRNDFGDPSRAFVEWTMSVSPAEEGPYTLPRSLPKGVEVTLERCGCVPEYWSHPWHDAPDPSWPAGSSRWLSPGIWRLRVYGPIGATIDLELETPCDFVGQNCGEGQQCSRYRECVDEVPDPAALGQPCEVPIDELAPRSCAGGLACVGPRGAEGVCMQHCLADACPGELVCGGWESVCATGCDPLADECPAGFACWGEQGVCLPSGGAGLLDSCRVFDLECGPGLVCGLDGAIDGCKGFREGVGPTGCCLPVCDPSADDPGCPVELPLCQGSSLGTCGVE
jgi:hypothetical protein